MMLHLHLHLLLWGEGALARLLLLEVLVLGSRGGDEHGVYTLALLLLLVLAWVLRLRGIGARGHGRGHVGRQLRGEDRSGRRGDDEFFL